MQKSYFGKVKMIYIDPPYNTGNEFIYPDKYSETLETYLAYTGQTDEQGKKFSTVTETSGRFHSRWLNMMYPRLYLARSLLKDTGSLWLSIDDNELNNLIGLGKTIFGDENYVACFVWQKSKDSRKQEGVLSKPRLCYLSSQRIKSMFEATRQTLPLTEEVRARYRNPDNDPRGDWQSVSINAQAGHGNTGAIIITIMTPGGRELPAAIWPMLALHKRQAGRSDC